MRAHGPQVVQAPRGKVVHDGHGLAVGQQPLHQVRADEAGAAGDQDVMRAADCVTA